MGKGGRVSIPLLDGKMNFFFVWKNSLNTYWFNKEFMRLLRKASQQGSKSSRKKKEVSTIWYAIAIKIKYNYLRR